MPRPKRPRRAETKPTSHVEPPPTAAAQREPRQPSVLFAADGMIEEPPASSWGHTDHAEPNDSRSLAELAASVMSAQHLVAAEVEQDAVRPPSESLARPVRTPTPTRAKVTIEEPEKPARRRGAGAIVLLLVILGGMGVAWLHSNVNDSASGGPQDGQLEPAPANGGSSGDGSGAPGGGGNPPEDPGNAAAAPIAPTPEPEPEQQAPPVPAYPPAAQPAPTGSAGSRACAATTTATSSPADHACR